MTVRPIRALVLIVEAITLLALMATLTAFWLELDDRRTERRLRAWEFILDVSTEIANRQEPVASGSAVRDALRVLNHNYPGKFCNRRIQQLSASIGGDVSRKCIIPTFERDRLTGLQLPHVDLTGVELQHVIFSRADLQWAVLDDAILTDSDFTGAALNGARLNRADLSNAALNGTDFEGARLTLANFTGTHLLRANASDLGTARTEARVRRLVAGTVGTSWNDVAPTILDGADLMFANLSEVTSEGVSFRGANLYGASLVNSEFKDANFTGTVIALADFSGVDLSGVRGLTQEQLNSTCIDPAVGIRDEMDELGLNVDKAVAHYETCRGMIVDPKKQRRIVRWVAYLIAIGLRVPAVSRVFDDPTYWAWATDSNPELLSESEMNVLWDKLCSDRGAVSRPCEPGNRQYLRR